MKRKMTFCAIDEILRGTNTGERIRASKAILEYISDKNLHRPGGNPRQGADRAAERSPISTVISVRKLGENDVAFSYKLMPGPATSQNAIALLRIAGFPDEILKAAGK